MKNINKIALFACCALSLTVSGCADFDEINRNPFAVSALDTKPYYALNKSIVHSQQNPDTAERLFVINWAAGARQDGEDGYGTSVGEYNDGFLSASYNHMSSALKFANDAITLCDEQMELGLTNEHDLAFVPNIKAFSRIWRVYLMSEFADSFGPMPVDGFQGTNPEFASLQDVYYFLYSELAEAVADINTGVEPTAEEAKSDHAYGFDAVKWKKYAISMWMRLAMRLSEADPAKAQSEFEKAVATGTGILTADETFGVQEKGGWEDFTGVMSRTWNIQTLSATFANLTTNLGGSKALEILADPSGILYPANNDLSRFEPYIKDANTYIGKRFDKHFTLNSDNPTKGLFFDGLPENIDPRALYYFFLPGDYRNRKATGYDPYFVQTAARQQEYMLDENGDKIEGTDTDATYAWNGLPAGLWNDEALELNGIVNGDGSYGYVGTYPALADDIRSGASVRVFFGPWETYFLLAEASLYGWNTGTTAEAAYNNGIKASLEYHNLGAHYDKYIDSENYNRVGTSVKFSHTTEPSPVEMTYVDGYTNETKTTTYQYPDASKVLYKGHKLNDKLTKIITQKYIANTPWLPLENISDHSRLGLPFWEIPASTTTISTMPEWNSTSYQGEQKPGHFFHRMRYPSSLKNADPEGYATAVRLLGGDDTGVTPLWWAIGGNR